MRDRPDLDHRVADAAEAWLADPHDVAVYARLVAAVAERRAALDAARPVADEQPDDEQSDDDLPDDEDAEPEVPLRPLGVHLVGDPRAVLDRLRRG